MPYRDQVHGLARAYGIQDLPDADVVREVTVFEGPEVIAGCLTEAGFPTETNGEGTGWGGELLKSQGQEHKVATITCLLQYPLMERYRQPETEEQLRVRYEWMRDKVVPCMSDLGHDPGPMPSPEVYISDARSGRGLWQPTREFPPETLRTLMPLIDEKCPAFNPPLDQLWPDG